NLKLKLKNEDNRT
ncbi:hypothetical protein MPH_08209, partial [Macrophomina phaseolina MS6]